MCGISIFFLDKSCESRVIERIKQCNIEQLQRRGPDGNGCVIQENSVLIASVLHIQGNRMVEQPYIDQNGNVLLWNGEVFGGIDCSDVSDTIEIAAQLQTCNSASEIVAILAIVSGPFAFIYYSVVTGNYFFGRDSFGRRSLLLLQADSNIVGFISVADQSLASEWLVAKGLDLSLVGLPLWKEVEVGGIYELKKEDDYRSVAFVPWPASRVTLCRNPTNIVIPPVARLEDGSASSVFLSLLMDAIRRRVRRLHSMKRRSSSCGKIGVLFSGGIDSVLLALALSLCLEDSSEPIELINVSFSGGGEKKDTGPSPDRLAAIVAHADLKRICPGREWRLVHVDVTADERAQHEERVRSLIMPCDTHMDLNIGTAFWFAARGRGYLRDYSKEEVLAVLGSEGGKDRPLLRVGKEGAAKAVGLTEEKEQRLHDLQITKKRMEEGTIDKQTDLKCLNPSCKRVYKVGCRYLHCKRCCLKKARGDPAEYERCVLHRIKDSKACAVDEVEGKRSHGKQRYGDEGRQLSVVEEEVRRPELIASLQDTAGEEEEVRSHELIADFLQDTAACQLYSCTCKALLIGIGADEQMAGYARHRTVFLAGCKKGGVEAGWAALEQELNMDMSRLWKRNLGRDDRCVSDHGREAWFPYLDEDLVRFLQSLPLSEIASLEEGQGVGDKKILRQAAKMAGLSENCSELVKRAIQFGTRVAKHTNELYHGSNRRGKGQTKL